MKSLRQKIKIKKIKKGVKYYWEDPIYILSKNKYLKPLKGKWMERTAGKDFFNQNDRHG